MTAETLAKYCIGAGLFITAALSALFWGEWIGLIILWCLGLPLITLALALVSGFFLSSTEQVQEQNIWIDETDEMIVGYSDEVFGKLHGANLHEWILLKRPDTGEVTKCFYERAVDLENEDLSYIGKRWFVITNGALYLEPEKEAAPVL